MALPKLNQNISFELDLPILKQKVLFRPFLVKEEKILLLAQQSDNPADRYRAIKQIIQNCDINETLQDLDSISLGEIEYIFLFLRSISVNDVITVDMKHPNNQNKSGESCNHVEQFEIKFDEIEFKNPENFSTETNIELDENTSINLRVPSLSTLSKTDKIDEESFDGILNMIFLHVNYLTHNDEIFKKEDYQKPDWDSLLESLSQSQIEKIGAFFKDAPKMRYEKTYTCAKCGGVEEIVFEGLSSFL